MNALALGFALYVFSRMSLLWLLVCLCACAYLDPLHSSHSRNFTWRLGGLKLTRNSYLLFRYFAISLKERAGQGLRNEMYA